MQALRNYIQHLMVAGITVSPFLLSGCAAFRASTVTLDPTEEHHINERYDASDMRAVTRGIVDKFLQSRFLATQENPPVMMIAGIQNRTHEHVDTKRITDRIRRLIFDTRTVRFINEDRRADLLEEQGYQATHVTRDQQAAIGRQLGAQYMVSGSLTEMKRQSPRQVRVSKKIERDYIFTVEVTNLETGELEWTDDHEFARQLSKPLIGW